VFKRVKKVENVVLDDEKSHIYLKETDVPLLLIRPEELIEFGELAGSESEDILLWVGKSIGKSIFKGIYKGKDIEGLKFRDKMKIVNFLLETLQGLGFGITVLNYEKDNLVIDVSNSIAQEHTENIMAKNVCIIYNGIFTGMLEEVGIDSEGREINCILKGAEMCSFKFEFEQK
jgi:predicted hydrocarbon binding protein